jgi:FkbM family methyltransferase
MYYRVTSGPFLTPGGAAVLMTYREGTNDWNTLTASLTQDEYHLPQGQSGVAVDVGGYLGSVAIALAMDNPAMHVTCIEPVPDNIARISQNISLNLLQSRITLIEGAVGHKGTRVDVRYRFTGSEVMEHHAFVGNSSLGTEDDPHEVIRYDATSLADLVATLGYIDFLKIDCEGGEWAFLDDPDIDQVAVIVGEAHAVGGRHGRDIEALLAHTHQVTLFGDGEGTCDFRAVRRA